MTAHALDRLRAARVIAVVRARTTADAEAVARSAAEGGIRAVELTFTVPGVVAAIARLHAERPDLLVGAGTVLDPDDARRAIDAGAEFVVSPGLDERVLFAALEEGVLALPGVLTPTEVMAALQAGASAVKLFPAGSLGPGHLAALLAPFPSLVVVPTGGIVTGEIGAWFGAGAAAVGIGGALSPSGRIDAETLGQVTATAAAMLDAAALATGVRE